MRVVELEKEVDNKQSEIDEKDKAIVELTVALDVSRVTSVMMWVEYLATRVIASSM